MVDNISRAPEDHLELVKTLQGFLVTVKLLVHKSKVVQSLCACGFHTEGFLIKILGLII